MDKSRETMEAFIYQELRNSILQRKLAPGNQLVENVISEKLNVSRTPIRGAIQKLAREGLVNVIPNRGAFVIQPTKEEIIQAYQLRVELEGLAAALAVDHMEDADFERMQQLCEQEAKSFRDSDLAAYLQINKSYHMVFIGKCGNRFLIEFAEKLIDQTNIYLMLFDMMFYHVQPQTAPGAVDHRELIQLFKDGNKQLVEEKVRTHISTALNNLMIENVQFRNLSDLF